MENLLENLGVGNQTLARRNQTLQNDLGFGLVRMACTHQIHRNIGVDEDQSWYPRSISLNICSRSAVGNAYWAPRRRAFNFVSGSITGRRARLTKRSPHPLSHR